MRAISLTQPWATLVAIGAKRVETRGWQHCYRGRVAIHAAKKYPLEAQMLTREAPFSTALGEVAPAQLQTGVILAVAELVQIFQFDGSSADKIRARSAAGKLPPFEVVFGDYSIGRFGFVLDNVRPLPAPIPCRGQLNLWEVPADVVAQMEAMLA